LFIVLLFVEGGGHANEAIRWEAVDPFRGDIVRVLDSELPKAIEG